MKIGSCKIEQYLNEKCDSTLIRHLVGIFLCLLHKKQYLWHVSQKLINMEVLIRHVTSESPKQIVTTVYNLYCSYYPFR
jgi:hypothetical protein